MPTSPAPVRRARPAAAFALAGAALAGPQAAAQSPPTLDQRIARLCEDLEQRRKDLRISGLSLAVVKDDRVILARGFGLRDREKNLPADEHTLYAAGSTTKAFTAMLCAILADEGRLAFDARPAEYLPWFRFKDPAADADATLRDLLCHRTGLTRTDLAWIGSEATREELLRLIARTEPYQPFRKAWQYNNAMFLLAGECAAAAAGAGYDELIAQRIFAPLGMERTVTTSAAALADPLLSQRYDWNAKKRDFDPVPWMAVDNMAPAGSICSTVVDMARWVRFLLNRGVLDGRRLVAESRFDEIWSDDDDLVPSYGLGWMLHDSDGQEWRDPAGAKHRVIEHGGNVGGYAAEVGLLPDQGLGLVLLTNTSATQLQQSILPMVWDAILGTWKERRALIEGPALPEEETSGWLGAYYDVRRPEYLPRALRRSEDRLVLILPPTAQQPAPTFLTFHWAGEDGRYWLREEPDSYATIEPDGAGGVASITLVRGHVTSTLQPVVARDGSRPPDLTLDELMAKRAEATGFESAAGWRTLRLTGTLEVPQSGLKGSYVVTARGTDALRVEFDAGRLGRSLLILSGGRGTMRANLGSVAEMSPGQVAALQFANPLVENGEWLDHAADVELTRVSTSSALGIPLGETCYSMSVTPGGADPIAYYVSTRDHRLVAVEGASAFAGMGASIPIAMLADVRDVRGLKMAFRRGFEAPQVGRVVVQFERAEVDVELPADAFDLPDAPAGVRAAGS